MAKTDLLKEGWEVSEFPILCDGCLGGNEYMRMTKAINGAECKVCTRPFTVFRWCPGPRMRFKKTEICQTCSKLKNVCQTCLLDLQYNLPVQVRDTVLGIQNEVPVIEANRMFYYQNVEQKLQDSALLLSKPDPVGRAILDKISRKEPYAKRNLPHVCSFFIRGECTRGALCPYRHEIDPNDEQLTDQSIKDRYYGVNDIVASNLLDKVEQLRHEDQLGRKIPTHATLAVFGIQNTTTESMLKDVFYVFGEIVSIKLVISSKCAFIQFKESNDAVKALEGGIQGLEIADGSVIKAAWAKKRRET